MTTSPKGIMNIDLSFICPVKDKAPYLKGFLFSLKEQDIWDRCELIWVENGSTDDSWKVMNDLYNKLGTKDKGKITLLQLKEANACIARNEGAKLAKGRYWSFLPADAALMPGMARIWVEALDEFPEYGFLYGGYRFGPPHGGVYPSEKFDLDMLKQYNYIDGSFPFKKELYPWWNNGGWDVNIKSLQDWDFWLAICLGKDKKGSGVKGLYRPEIYFETIPPQKGGLSFDSHENWIERTKQIKDKWGITESDICVTSPGAPFHGKNVSKILKAEYRHAPNSKPHNFKMIYLLGFYPQLAQQCSQSFMLANGNMTSGKKVIHWIGSDVWGLLQMRWMDLKKLITQFEINNFIHLCEFEQSQKELKDLGITAKVVPLPPLKLYKPMPFPKGKFTVAVYMPDQNQEFYFKDLMTEIALAIPEFNFLFYGNRFDQSKHKNIQNVGYMEDMEKFIAECHAIIRLTAHDGQPMSLLEFVMAGRNALFNIKMPWMTFVNSYDKDLIIQKVRDLKKLPLNEKGSDHYRKLLNQDLYRKRIRSILTDEFYNPTEYWESRAHSWDYEAKHTKLPHLKEIEKALKGIEYKSVLDIGCGNGRWSQYFHDKVYWGIDISTKMINVARTYYPDKTFKVRKVENIAEDLKEDLVFSYTCLHHLKEKDFVEAAGRIKKISRYALLIESVGAETRDWYINHDYHKYFNIIKEFKAEKADDNPDTTLTLMLVDNGGKDANK
jgi:2-polyprenyl-3-methyl-5-hydroxy-6-metoxy-1,4-benzoquinol methylase